MAHDFRSTENLRIHLLNCQLVLLVFDFISGSIRVAREAYRFLLVDAVTLISNLHILTNALIDIVGSLRSSILNPRSPW